MAGVFLITLRSLQTLSEHLTKGIIFSKETNMISGKDFSIATFDNTGMTVFLLLTDTDIAIKNHNTTVIV